VVLNTEFAGTLLQRQLARLNLNVLRSMARMLDEQEQKFTAERNTLRATGRMMRAEVRRALSETVKINSERRKLDLERDVLQSQLLARRRSARLLERMLNGLGEGRDTRRLYMYSRVLGSAPSHRDLGQQLDYETDMLDLQRFYLESLMAPRWREREDGGSLYPVELTGMHPPSVPASEIESGGHYVPCVPFLTPDCHGVAGQWPPSAGVPSGQVQSEERLAADELGTKQVSQPGL
jgi:hypothetical protein